MTTDYSQPFRLLLNQGQVPLGDFNLPISSSRSEFLESIQNRLEDEPRKWSADSSTWTKYRFQTGILWYAKQSVFFTFRNEALELVEFSDNTKPDAGWDYDRAVQKYFQIKEEIVTQLGEESKCRESTEQDMEAVWSFARLYIYLSCDVKTGGCGIGLRPLIREGQSGS